MKRLVLIWLCAGISATSFSQENKLADSLYFLQTGKRLSDVQNQNFATGQSYLIYFTQSSRNNQRLTMKNATQLIADTNQQAGYLAVDFMNNSGGLHLAREPYQLTETGIYTEGYTTLNRVKIAGTFRFEKQWADSLANNLGSLSDDIAPYHYFTPKAGRYEGQRYDMSAILSYQLNRNLYAGAAVDYLYRWITGSVDPRIDAKEFKMNFSPSLSWRSKNTFVGIEYRMGKGNENMGIVYKNKMYNYSNLYPDRFYYLNMGYGNIALKYDVVNRRDTDINGGGLSFSTSKGTLQLRSVISYQQAVTKNKQKYDSLKVSDVFSRWNTDRLNADILLTVDKRMLQQFSLRMNLLTGRDYNSLYEASNFTGSENTVLLGYHRMQKNDKPIRWQYGVSMALEQKKLEDILAAHYVERDILTPEVSGQLYLKDKKGNLFTVSLAPSLMLPLKNRFEAPSTQVNVFTRRVAYPDFYYYSYRLACATMQFQMMTPHFIQKIYSGLFVKATYVHKLNSNNFENIPLGMEPANSRISILAGIHFFL